MGQQVSKGASIQCSFGTTPATLSVLPANMVNADGNPAATIMDYAPTVNIPAFGMCSAPTNPTVISATAAAAGVLTPQSCIPLTVAPWTPGCATVKIGGMSALNNSSKCTCTWLGVISITAAGTTTVNIP